MSAALGRTAPLAPAATLLLRMSTQEVVVSGGTSTVPLLRWMALKLVATVVPGVLTRLLVTVMFVLVAMPCKSPT
jgi:hypothetical protein